MQLTGYDPQKLMQTPFRQLFPKLTSHNNVILPEDVTETTLQTGSGSQKTIGLDVKAMDARDEEGRPLLLIIAKDMSTDKWLEQQSRSGKALYTGICDSQYRIRTFHAHGQRTMSGESVVHQSIFDYLDPSEHTAIRERLIGCSLADYPCDIVVRTIKFDEASELELRATICTMFDGFGAIQQYAFSVWDMRESGEAGQPGMKLKIWMAKRDISASQLSASTGISMQTISKLRNGKIRKPQRLTAELLASELKVDVSALWSELSRR